MNRGKETSLHAVEGSLTPEKIFAAVRNTPPDISNKGFLTVLRSMAEADIPAPTAASPRLVTEKADSTAKPSSLPTRGTIFRLAPVGLDY